MQLFCINASTSSLHSNDTNFALHKIVSSIFLDVTSSLFDLFSFATTSDKKRYPLVNAAVKCSWHRFEIHVGPLLDEQQQSSDRESRFFVDRRSHSSTPGV